LLEEQHNELLSLLAQQELELKIFKDALMEEFGEEKSHFFEEEAQKKVIDTYGVYTNYREYQT
jgi:U3 small nucleolar RNA-associated protein 14